MSEKKKSTPVEWPVVRPTMWSINFAFDIRWPSVENTAMLFMFGSMLLAWNAWYFGATTWFGHLFSVWFWIGLGVWLYVIRSIASGPHCKHTPNLTGKVAIVTGSNTGIGLETARQLWTLGATVILACRDTQKAGDAQRAICTGRTASAGSGDTSRCRVMKLDVASLASVRQFASDFKALNLPLHYLVNNAGS